MRETVAPRRGLRRYASTAVLCGGTAIIGAALLVNPTTFLSAASVAPGASSPGSVATQRGPLSSNGFAAVVDAVKPAVIDIRARALDDEAKPGRALYDHHGPGTRTPHYSTSQGTGFFITADGYAVTNHHVIKGSKVAEIRTDSGDTYRAEVVGEDAASDLALLKVEGGNDFPHVRFADTTPPVGDWIVAIGNPFGLGGTVTAGIVSAHGRDLGKDSYEDLIQIDAPVNKGNSGGPTFDLDGNVIGVNTVIISPTGGSVGIAFAIPAARVKRVVEQLREKGSVTRGWLGLQFQSVSPEIAESLGFGKALGVIVADVRPGSPAAQAGLVVGDRIQSMNGTRVRDAHAFNSMLDDALPGATVMLGAVHKGREVSIAAVMGTAPAAIEAIPATLASSKDGDLGNDRQRLGLLLTPVEPSSMTGGRGAVVASIDPAGLAAARGISPGDVILDAANQPVATPDDVYKRFSDAQRAGKPSMLLRVRSGELRALHRAAHAVESLRPLSVLRCTF